MPGSRMASRVADGADAGPRSSARSAGMAAGRPSAATGSASRALAAASSPVSFRNRRRSIIPPDGPSIAPRAVHGRSGRVEFIDTLPVLFYHTSDEPPTFGVDVDLSSDSGGQYVERVQDGRRGWPGGRGVGD